MAGQWSSCTVFLGSMVWFDRLAPRLAEGLRVVRTDLLGHGRSAKPDRGYAPEDQAGILDALLGQLGVTSATVLGHSMGADIAIALAERGGTVEQLIVIDEGPEYMVATPPAVNSVLRLPGIGGLIYRSLPAFAFRMAVMSFFAPRYRLTDAFHTPERPVDDARAVPYACFRSSQAEKSVSSHRNRWMTVCARSACRHLSSLVTGIAYTEALRPARATAPYPTSSGSRRFPTRGTRRRSKTQSARRKLSTHF
jgi:pimeloyl-ACP methyl ester carboxylesterase